MRRFGILAETQEDTAPVDGYAVKRRYRDSLWPRAAGPTEFAH
jgi:hypothetical protein